MAERAEEGGLSLLVNILCLYNILNGRIELNSRFERPQQFLNTLGH